MYDPCDLNLYRPLPDAERAAARQSFGFAPDDIVLVHHGILHPNKGNDWILRALADIRAEVPQLRYLLIGDGPEMKPCASSFRNSASNPSAPSPAGCRPCRMFAAR